MRRHRWQEQLGNYKCQLIVSSTKIINYYFLLFSIRSTEGGNAPSAIGVARYIEQWSTEAKTSRHAKASNVEEPGLATK